MSSRALTIHAPWAWAIVNGLKRVENREWLTDYRGPLLIHAGLSEDSDDPAGIVFQKLGITEPEEYVRGAIIGEVDLTAIYSLEDYLERYGEIPNNREFAVGPWCWVLENPRMCQPFYCPGNFQLWPVKEPEKIRFPEKTSSPAVPIRKAFEQLLEHYGSQKWWPAESPLEVILGVVLVRNSQWSVAARVIDAIKNEGLLQLDKLAQLDEPTLQEKIRPVGRQKAKATLILSLVRFFLDQWQGNLMAFFGRPIEHVREELLTFSGIGPETVELILLYAGNLPACPVSIYTKRFLIRHHYIEEKADHRRIQHLLQTEFGHDHAVFNEFYALLTRLGRDFCAKSEPKCESCPLNGLYPQETSTKTT